MLLGWLYDAGGVVDNSDKFIHNRLLKTLRADEKTFQKLIETAVKLGMLDAVSWRKNRIVSRGVCDEVMRRKTAQEQGKRGGRPPKKNPDQKPQG